MSNFYDRIAAAASRFGERPAIEVVGPGGQVTTTYRQLIRASERTATWLTEVAGTRDGDRVAILSANSSEWISAYLGILHIGAVAIPLDTNYNAAQIQTVMADSGARALLVSEKLEASGARAVMDLPGTTLARVEHTSIAPGATEPTAESRSASATARGEDDAAAILYTSGTTADPKGVVLTHGNLEAERAAALAVITVSETDAVLGVLPLFHALAQMANLLLPLTAGARVVFLETVNSSTLLDALQSRGITIFACVPQFFYLVHQRVMNEVAARGALMRRIVRLLISACGWLRDRAGINLGPRLFARVHHAFGPRIRFLITGGSRFDPAIARDFYGMGLPLLNGYGLTETSGAATVVRPGDRFTTSVGPPLPGVEIRIIPDAIVDPDQAAAGVGEIQIRGPIVMRGYFGRTHATSEAMDGGWLRTGDLGRVDSHGRVYITGRKKEVIVLSSGKNLYPEEIEAHYRQSPFIKELAVIGANDPAVPAAERLHAIVVPDADALRARGIVNVRELIRFELEGLAVQLPAHKRVLSYDVSTEPLPRTTTGKLRRPEIERGQRTQTAGVNRERPESEDDKVWLSGDDRSDLVTAIGQRLGRERVRAHDNLELDLHLDSMERVELLVMLEERAKTRVTPDVRATIFTVRDLVDAVVTAPRATAAAVSSNLSGTEWHSILNASPDGELEKILTRPATLRALCFFVALRCVGIALRILFRIRIDGVRTLPRTGPCIITPNHQTYLDGFLLATALPFGLLRQIFFVGASEYFETRLTRALARAANIVPVDPDANLINAMQAAATGLRVDKVLILFPEGERSIDGTLKPFRKGAAILASELDVPVIPVAIAGLFDVWPRGRGIAWHLCTPWRRHEIRLTFGTPVRLGSKPYGEGAEAIQRAVGLLIAGSPDAR